ncbi:MAG: carboxylesterase/lipase family protein [Solobacterium sp.]|nr:carboxylesterase/lipase family protein [Solobacterium sp.]
MAMNFIRRHDYPLVQTTSGTIRGYVQDDVFNFRGIPYGEAKRFMPPTPIKPWSGILDTQTYGPVSIPLFKHPIDKFDTAIGMRFWPASEDCLNLNIWTNNINNETKKPVMFWIHGGGFAFGSSVELLAYEAENLVKKEDVVVVTVNHRLNIWGYLNLSAYGEEYKCSGTAGIADLVLALRWVKDNISRFGGDPSNVMIFGQSGGGMKVQALMQVKDAEGLFHRAAIQSGCEYHNGSAVDLTPTVEESLKTADLIVNELGLTKDTIQDIQTKSTAEIEQAVERLVRKGHGELLVRWGPIANEYYPGTPLDAGLMDCSDSIPVIIGSNIGEWAETMGIDYGAESSDETKMQLLQQQFGEHTDEMIAEFRKVYPDKDLIVLHYLDNIFRYPSLLYAQMRAAKAGTAPTYLYILGYNFDFNGGFPAWHCSEIPLIFRSSLRMPIFHEEGAQKLQEEMSSSWAQFARTGDPNNPAIPEWHPYTVDEPATMVFDKNTAVRIGHDQKLTEMLHEYTIPGDIGEAIESIGVEKKAPAEFK